MNDDQRKPQSNLEKNTKMNMTTEEIIADLRQNGLTSASIYTRMERAANRLEELQRANQSTLADLALALSERTPHDYGLLKDEIAFLRKERSAATVNQQLTVRPEPSRLEIAAMVFTTDWCDDAIMALQYADQLIAAAKETK